MTKSKTTALRIVDHAMHLLIEVGHADFSMRKVADRAGISVGNLTYHFPSRAGLIHSVVRLGFELFQIRLIESIRIKGAGVEKLRDAVTWTIEIASDKDNACFQREAWALASHDSEVAGILASFYEGAAGTFRELLLELNPTASDDQLKVATSAFGLASEGTVILNDRYVSSGAGALVLALTGHPGIQC